MRTVTAMMRSCFSLPAVVVGLRMSDDNIPDIRDGLTRKERIVLKVLHETQRERGNRNVPTPMLWGRVCEYFYISPEELSLLLARLGARR